MEIVFENEGG